ncbi:MAG: hypothetical protein E7397_03850 [Ruminococcaceae bacterium]|nr:hypothetical protein [Oscillospiraceae bacterium]
MKKIIIGISLAIIFVICLCVPYWVDDFACAKYHREIEDIVSSAEEIKVIDILSGCGNPANGNHTSKIVVVLVETKMSLTDLKNEFPKAFEIMPFDELLQETKTFNKFSKHISGNGNENYVIVYAESAPFYYLDLRGH